MIDNHSMPPAAFAGGTGVLTAGGGGAVTALPHCSQKRTPSANAAPHFAQQVWFVGVLMG
jgi:hypothetical protein